LPLAHVWVAFANVANIFKTIPRANISGGLVKPIVKKLLQRIPVARRLTKEKAEQEKPPPQGVKAFWLRKRRL
jgi:hypothetical protein